MWFKVTLTTRQLVTVALIDGSSRQQIIAWPLGTFSWKRQPCRWRCACSLQWILAPACRRTVLLSDVYSDLSVMCVEFSSVSTKKRTWLSEHLLQGMIVTGRRLNPRPPKCLTALLYTTVGTLCKNSNEFDKTHLWLWLLQISLPVVSCYIPYYACGVRHDMSDCACPELIGCGEKRLHAASIIITVKSGISQFNLATQRLCTVR